MGRLTNLIFNFQFQIPSLLQSVLKLSISDFAFLRKNTLLICWEKLLNFLNTRGPPGVRGPQFNNRCFRHLVKGSAHRKTMRRPEHLNCMTVWVLFCFANFLSTSCPGARNRDILWTTLTRTSPDGGPIGSYHFIATFSAYKCSLYSCLVIITKIKECVICNCFEYGRAETLAVWIPTDIGLSVRHNLWQTCESNKVSRLLMNPATRFV
jgi:hypothetical protein